MTKQTDEALKMAIEGIENLIKVKGRHHTEIATLKLFNEVLPKCKEALEPEPMTTTDVITCKMAGKCCMTGEALEQPAWQGLSNDRIREIGDNCLENNNGLFNWIDFARAIEQELKTKNGFSGLKEKNNE